MAYVGIDLHKRESQICMKSDDGTIVKEVRIPSRRSAFLKEANTWPTKTKVLLESSTSSEWVASTLESVGHEVIVADPNYAPMMGERRKRKVKTDKRDARALADACRLGAYRQAYRMSRTERLLRGAIACRANVITARTRLINMVRAQVLQFQEPVPACSAEAFVKTVRDLTLPPDLKEMIEPSLCLIEKFDETLASSDEKLEEHAHTEPAVRRLTTIPGVGPITALMFTAVIGKAERFHSAAHASAYLGLVPGENSSGDGVRRTGITKTGNKYLRTLLVQCAYALMRSRHGGGLAQWAKLLGEKRTKKVAAVALARRLARVMWALARNGTDFDHTRHKPRRLKVIVTEVAA